jgi:hypothetical protein
MREHLLRQLRDSRRWHGVLPLVRELGDRSGLTKESRS